MKREPLPIDDALPRLVREALSRRRLLLVAEPGAGKTTRLPAALLDAKELGDGGVLVAQPRRIAARMAARRVAEELGESVGERVGYAVRFEKKAGPKTRLLFVTVGVLLRRLMAEPTLPGVSAVVLDEIHERTAELDLCLALLRQLTEQTRKDLLLVGMSATVEARALADYLACEVHEVSGRAYPIEVEYLDKPDTRHLDVQVASAARRLLRRIPEGDLLVFLPGAGEIRRALERLQELPEAGSLDLLPLHGSLPVDQQERAVRRSNKRKVIVSTNVAETSLTIPGVVAVIDSGLARVAGTSPQTGMPSLLLSKVSQASARQRAGRAGRLGPGFALRLYTQHDHDARPLHDEPEMLRVDLTETLLRLHLLGHDPHTFALPAAPPARALEAAEDLLRRLGALREGEITELGRRLAEVPAHPRVARVMLEAQDRGAGSRGALLAALMGEREIRRELRGHALGGQRRPHGHGVGASDLLARVERFEAAELEGLNARSMRSHDLEPMATKAVAQARDSFARAMRVEREAAAFLEDEEEALLLATLAGFPDRVAKRATGRSYRFAAGRSGELDESSVVEGAELLVAVEVQAQGKGEARIHAASTIRAEHLLELFPDDVVERRELRFDRERETVEVVNALDYGALVLDESVRRDVSGEDVSQTLADAAREHGLEKLFDMDAIEALRRRARFASEYGDPLALADPERVDEALLELCQGVRSFADLRGRSLLAALNNRISAAERKRLDAWAPEFVAIPGRPRVPLEYGASGVPSIASRMQDFFGAAEGPRIAGGKVPVVLHLLAPNGRDVQVTTDLAGFWEKHYPALRRELSRRYARHAWPEDPRTAQPSRPAPRRRRS